MRAIIIREMKEDDRPAWCHCPPKVKATMQFKGAVRALAKAYGTKFDINPCGVSDVELPEALARLFDEFERGAFPELLDPDVVKLEEIAKEHDLDAERLADLAWNGFIACLRGFVDDDIYLRKSEFDLAEVSRLMEEETAA